MNSTSKGLLISLLVMLALGSCTQSELNFSDREAKKYSIYIMAKDGKEYILETNSLDSGRLIPEEEGAELDIRKVDRSVLVRKGFYYHTDRKAGAFVKYDVEGHGLKRVAALPLNNFSLENYHWLGGDTLLLTGLSMPDFSQVRYVMLHSGDMSMIRQGNMDIPIPSGRFDNLSVGFVERNGASLLLGYTYHQQLGISDYTTSDTTYISQLSYPDMHRISIDKDTRSTYPGGVNTVQSSAFYDAQHNYYFMTCPGIALGNRPELSTAVMRINRGKNTSDKTYFFDLSKALGNHAYGMWSIGAGKAIVRAERKDLFKGLGDHYSTAHFEFYLVDVVNQTVLEKLDLPLDKGTRRECVLVENGIVYISVNSDTAGNYIWKYDIKRKNLEKGVQLSGNSDYILRIDRLH